MVCDVPLLVESPKGRGGGYEAVIVVEAPGAAAGPAGDPRRAPPPTPRPDRGPGVGRGRRKIATHVVDNAGDLPALESQVDDIWADLERRHRDEQDRASAT